jgi:hypothetical protein
LAVVDLPRLALVTGGRAIKEIEFVRVQGAAHLSVALASLESGHPPVRLLIAAETTTVRRVPFTVDSIRTRLAVAVPAASIVGVDLLEAHDPYYSQDGQPLPVVRVRFDDPDGTWLHVDPVSSQLVDAIGRGDRRRRWLRAFHELDLGWFSLLLRRGAIATP